MSDFKVITPKRDIARELARRYSTMTHDELDVLESILEPIKYGKGEKILVEGEVCRNISTSRRDWYASSIPSMGNRTLRC